VRIRTPAATYGLSLLIAFTCAAVLAPTGAGSTGTATTAATPADTTYPLVCRGGGGIEFLYYGSWKEVLVTFRQGTRPARDGVAPGTCTWMDRGLTAGEPSAFCHAIDRLNISWRADRLVNISSAEGEYLLHLLSPGRTVVFDAYNDRNSNPSCVRDECSGDSLATAAPSIRLARFCSWPHFRVRYHSLLVIATVNASVLSAEIRIPRVGIEGRV
jgi:hypothetical protein